MPAREDMNQNIMLVAGDNRKKLKKDLSKFQLNHVNLMQILGLEIPFLKQKSTFSSNCAKNRSFDKMWKLTYI